MFSHLLSREKNFEKLQVPLPHETSFNAADNRYTESEFLKICEDYRVPDNPMRYRDEKFCSNYQRGTGWPDDYLGPDSMTWWIIETSVGFTDVGLLRISESVRAYAYLILSSQASARSSIVGNTASALTAQSAFLNNFEDIVNHRVNIQEDIKCYQDTLSYASSKVDYSIGESTYMLPSDLKLKIKTGTVWYDNKILVSNGNFILGKNEKVNSLETPAIKNHKTNSLETPTIKTHKTNPLETPTMKSTQTAVNSERTADLEQKMIISHEDEKVPLVLSLTGIFTIWFIFR